MSAGLTPPLRSALRRHINTHRIQPVIQRVDEGAGRDSRQQRCRRRADDLRAALGAFEPIEEPQLIVGTERTDVVEDERAAIGRGGKRQVLAGFPS